MILQNSLRSQTNEHIYLISGNSRDIGILASQEISETNYNSEYYCKSNPIILWQHNHDTLRIVDTLNYNKRNNGYFTKIRHFEDEGWIYLIERDADFTKSRFDKWEDLQDQLSFLNYERKDSIYLRRFNTDSILYGSRNAKPIRSFYLQNELFTTCATYEKSGIPYRIICNSSMDTLHMINKGGIKDLHAKFESGFQDHFVFTSLYYALDGKFKTRKGHIESDVWEPYDFYVPSSKEDGQTFKYFNVCYLTPVSRYLMGYKEKTKNLDSNVIMYIHDRHQDIWDSISIPRYYTKFNVYKDEYAYGSGMKQYLENDTEADQDISIAMNKHKYESDYGCTPDLRKALGRFYIFHIPSKSFDEMKFEERDVELLAIKDETIYYRKFDEIRIVKLGKDKKINRVTDKLLLKNSKIVPFVHHIFFSKADHFGVKIN